jgi:hypothetical protein
MSNFSLRAIITATDRLTPVLRGQIRTLNSWKRQFADAGKGAIPMAAALGAAIIIPAKAFADAESAAIGLKSALMTNDGLSKGFQELSDISTELGNKLPGTTADFARMAMVMKTNGLATDSMINGGLKAAAYLAIATQGLGETYESAALGITKISNVFGVADKDFVNLADTMQRVVNIGVGIEPFTSAMSKAGGAMKAVHQQGLGAAQSIAPLVALLVRSGVDPSEAGTGLKKLISVAGGTGKFKNIEGMVAGLEKMYKQDPAKLIKTFKELFGEEHGGKAIIIAAGGYKTITEEMKKQATLDMRVQESLKSLTNAWDAATGTFTNAMVAFAANYAPEIKELAQSINDVAAKLQKWASENGDTIKMVIKTAGAFVGMKLAFYGAAIGMGVLTAAMRMNPFLLLLQGAVIAFPWIYENWDNLVGFIKDRWQAGLEWLDSKFQNFIDGLLLGVNAIRSMFNFSDIKVTLPKLGNATVPSAFFSDTEKQSGMTLPGVKSPAQAQRDSDARKRMTQTGTAQVKGAIDVNFNNAPPGLRVVPYKGGNVSVKPNVGYRSLGMAGAQ